VTPRPQDRTVRLTNSDLPTLTAFTTHSRHQPLSAALGGDSAWLRLYAISPSPVTPVLPNPLATRFSIPNLADPALLAASADITKLYYGSRFVVVSLDGKEGFYHKGHSASASSTTDPTVAGPRP
jgi:hypothetical protein